jgi:MinD-like ATPase involved in chromosome partitioning or flagellar assembly
MTRQTSPEKVRAALTQAVALVPELQRQAAGMNALMIAPLVSFLPQIERMAVERIPADPDVLDAILERAALMVLALKSDAPAAIDAPAELIA